MALYKIAAVLAASAAAAAAASTCVSSSTQATIVPSTTARCLVAYSTSWAYLGMQVLDGTGSAVTYTSSKAQPVYIELYRGSDCAPDAFLEDITCTAGTPPTKPTTTPTTKPTSTPTTKPTSTPTSKPTTKPTSTPTTKPTSTPTTKPTSTPTSKPTSTPTTKPTTTPTTKPTTTPTTKPTSPGSKPPATGYNGGPPSSQYRAMYVWNNGGMSDCMLNQVAASAYPSTCGYTDVKAYQAAFFASLRNPWGEFEPYNRIFIELDINTVNAQPAIVRSFIAAANAQGIAVEFLAGQATWVTTAALMAVPVQMCKDISSFNAGSSSAAQRFAGVQLDIEPHTLGAAWHTGFTVAPGMDRYNDAYEANYISIFRSCKAALTPNGATVSNAVGYDYYYYVTDLWNALVANPYVDYVVIMNYFNNEDEFINGEWGTGIGGVNSILAATKNVVPVAFALETISPPWAPASASFWTNGTLAAENVLGDVGNMYANKQGFLGLVTHHYGSYFSLPPAGPITPTCTVAGSTISINPDSTTYACAQLYTVDAAGVWKGLTQVALNGGNVVATKLPATSASGYALELYELPDCTNVNVNAVIPTATC